MTPEISPAAIALRAPQSLYTGLPAVGGLPARDTARAPVPDVAGRNHRLLRRLVSALGNGMELLALVYAFPFVILAIGIPIALLVRLAMWIVGVG